MNGDRALTKCAGTPRLLVAACVAMATLLANVPDAAAQGNRAPANFTVLPVTITSVAVENGQVRLREALVAFVDRGGDSSRLGDSPRVQTVACQPQLAQDSGARRLVA